MGDGQQLDLVDLIVKIRKLGIDHNILFDLKSQPDIDNSKQYAIYVSVQSQFCSHQN